MGVCFVEPAKFDVVLGGQKIAGAGQRRTRTGLLHQGTLQPTRVPHHFGAIFAQHLSDAVAEITQPDAESLLLPEAQNVAAHKYGAPSWLTDRSPASVVLVDSSH